MKILDIGCGPGSITIDFAHHVPQGTVTGLENVPDPLPAARNLAAAQGLTNITFMEGDIHSLPFPDSTFDIVHVHQVLQHIADPIQGLKEMRRVVKKGGIVSARESAGMSWYPPNEGITKWKELYERMGRASGGNPHPGSQIHVWAMKAGFEEGAIKRSSGSWCFSSAEERRYWGGSMVERTRSSGYAKRAVEGGFLSVEESEEIADGWEAFVEDEEGWFGMLHGEILCWK
jgi:ubiquinone/menaquinone biosynthesis C-methylase UbiE